MEKTQWEMFFQKPHETKGSKQRRIVAKTVQTWIKDVVWVFGKRVFGSPWTWDLWDLVLRFV